MLETVVGVVIRETIYGESDKLLTVLTAEHGRISVCAKGARSMKNPYLAAVQMFCYSEMTLYRKGERYWLREAALIENFYAVRDDLERYSLALYFADIASEFSEEGVDCSGIMSLFLNSLYMLVLDKRPQWFIKAVFELRAASDNGYRPNLVACDKCGNGKKERFYIDIMNGSICCSDCFGSSDDEYAPDDIYTVGGIIIPISYAVLEAMRYIVYSSPKRIFSFSVDEGEIPSLRDVCEKYLLNHIERGFSTLDFYKQLITIGKE